ncbi:MAG: transcriptional repressor LexA [Ectothiorhodospiraceae bacterium]|nr:transcriptional repressor LexA [Ectothiorhodospiraceae bacterium]MCH8503113.1 transcriptional repressor LexA [Ectothiorhodospiraceae bacterium]
MQALTQRQTEILRFIRDFIREHGFPPTRADITRGLGFRSPNAAESHLRALARKGALEIQAGSSRGIRLLGGELEPEEEGLPIIGQVAAGSPVLAEEHIHGRCPMDASLFSPRADYLLTVRGMSMRDAGILEGDLLAVHSTREARNGQVVVARLHDEVTVKRFRKEGHQVWLLPENPDFKPIEVDLRTEPLVIEGLGVGLIRNGLAL